MTLPLPKRELERRTDTLEHICIWRDALQERIWQAQIRFEFSGLDPDEQAQLEAEVAEFKAVCYRLAARAPA